MSTAEAPAIRAEAAATEAPAAFDAPPYLFSADDFYRMIDGDIFPDEARVELWEGRIYEKMAKKQPHSVAGGKLVIALVRVLPATWCLWAENPITIEWDSAPLPDMTILRGKPDDYLHRRPTAADVALVVELAYSSLKADTGPKLAAYAAAGVPAYWVVNLVADVIHVYESPIPAERKYGVFRIAKRGEGISLALDGAPAGEIAVDDLLPAR